MFLGLAGEQWREASHQRALAAASLRRFRAEIARNREAVAAVHGEFFRAIRPVNTIIQVTRFIDPDWLVEIEANAVIDDEEAP